MADDRIKLGLDLGDSSAKAKELASSLGSVRAAAQDVADVYDVVGDTYELATTEVDDFADSILAEIVAANKAAAAGDSLARSKRSLATASDRASEAVGKTNSRLGDMSRGALQTSQAIQDVTQGGLASGLNNLDGIVGSLAKSIGLSATAATALSGGLLALGTAALVFGPAIWEWVQAMGKGAEEIPETKSALDKLNEALETAKGRLDAMKEGWRGSKEEVQEYKKAQAEVVALEAKAKEASANQKAIDAQKAKEEAPDEYEKAASSEASKAVEAFGGIDKFRQSLENAQSDWFVGDYQQKLDAALKEGREEDAKVLAGLLEEARQKRKADADALAGRFLRGDAKAGAEIDAIFPGRGFDVAGGMAEKTRKEVEALEKQVAAKEDGEEATRIQRAKAAAAKAEADEEKAFQQKKLKDEAEFAKEQRDKAAGWNAEDKAAADVKAKAEKEAAEAQTAQQQSQLQQFAASQGVDISDEQIGPVLDSMKKFMAAGANPMEAAAGAMQAFLQANQATMNRLQALEAQMGGFAQQAYGQMRQMQQIQPTLLPRAW